MRGPASISVTFKTTFVEHFQPVMAQLGRGIVQLRRQFNAGGAAAHNVHPHVDIGGRIGLQGARHAQTVIQQFGAESVGLQPAVQEDAMLRHAFGAEIIRHRAHRQHQIIITDAMAAHDLAPVLVLDRRDQQMPRIPVNAVHRAIEKPIAPGMTVAAIAHLVQIGVQRTGGHLVQQRLPDMGAVLFDQDDVNFSRPSLPPSRVASSSPPAPPPTTTIWVLRRLELALVTGT
jgi:hypothetical protein